MILKLTSKVIIYICVCTFIVGGDQIIFEKINYPNARLERQAIHQIKKTRPYIKMTLSIPILACLQIIMQKKLSLQFIQSYLLSKNTSLWVTPL